jgi:hypothetical protein
LLYFNLRRCRYAGAVCGYNVGSISTSSALADVSGDIAVGGVCGVGKSSNITNCYYNKYRCTERNLSGDMNNDGVSNALDASAILKYIVGIAA